MARIRVNGYTPPLLLPLFYYTKTYATNLDAFSSTAEISSSVGGGKQKIIFFISFECDILAYMQRTMEPRCQLGTCVLADRDLWRSRFQANGFVMASPIFARARSRDLHTSACRGQGYSGL